MINKLLKVAFCVICLFLVVECCHMIWLISPIHHYVNYTIVVDIEDDGTIVTEDDSGNLWAFKSKRIYHINDTAPLLMDDAGTKNDVTDDIILRSIERVEGGWRYYEVF